MSKRAFLVASMIAALVAPAATAQIIGGVTEQLGSGPGPIGGTVDQVVGQVGDIGRTLDPPTGSLIGGLSPASDGIWGIPGLSGVGDVPGITDLPGVTAAGGSGTSNGASRFLRGAIMPSLDRVAAPMGYVRATAKQMAQMRKARLEVLIRTYKDVLAKGPEGVPVRKAELIVTNPDSASLALAIRAGFRVKADEQASELGIRMVTLAVPAGLQLQEGVARLRQAAPLLDIDYNHVFEPAGGALKPAAGAALAAAAPPVRPGTRIAMIDGGVASHPSLAEASVEQQGFAGPAQPTGHGTAIGSLLVGQHGQFRGAARGAELFVGDVYGGIPSAGSATAIVKALAWAASKRPSVINVSLVGPDNRAVARAIAAIQARGIRVVAAVGNDGPAAPPAYPASYPGVVAVTGVDAGDRALREAGKAVHADFFAAPGADLVAALPGKGFTPVRGTSFAAPFVAARLAATGTPAQLAAEAVPGKGKVGKGIVCRSCRILPKMVGLK